MRQLCCAQFDDPHETVPHSNHASDTAAVEVAKASARMRTAVQAFAAARPTQVMAAEL